VVGVARGSRVEYIDFNHASELVEVPPNCPFKLLLMTPHLPTVMALLALCPSQHNVANAYAAIGHRRAAFVGAPSSSFHCCTRTRPFNKVLFASHASSMRCFARRRNSDEYDDDSTDEDYDDRYDEDEDYDDDYQRRRQQRRRRRRDDLGTPSLTGSSPDDTSLLIPSAFGRGDSSTFSLRLPPSVSASLLAGVFVLGIGTGVTVDSQINTNPRDLASRDAVDKNAPNPTLCTTYGASAMAFDQRVFVSFNPFNVYVAQADVKPACVLRPSNVVPILKERKLLNDDEIRSCKMNMNTWAFVGDLNDQPQLSCVYKSEDAQNEFLDDPKRGIGEDYMDDDLRKMRESNSGGSGGSSGGGFKKMVKDTLTEGQKRTMLEMGTKTMDGS